MNKSVQLDGALVSSNGTTDMSDKQQEEEIHIPLEPIQSINGINYLPVPLSTLFISGDMAYLPIPTRTIPGYIIIPLIF